MNSISAAFAPLSLYGKPNVFMPDLPEMSFANRYNRRGWWRSVFEKASLKEEAKLRADAEFRPQACAANGVTCTE